MEKINRHPDSNRSGHIEQKEQINKKITLLYRENDSYNEIIPSVITNLSAQGYQIDLETITRSASEEEARQFAQKVLENKKDQLVFSDLTCTVSDDQISLNEILNNSNEIAFLNKNPENNAKIIVNLFEELEPIGFNFNKVIIIGSNLADHLQNSSKWQKDYNSQEELIQKRIIDDNNAAEVIKKAFQEKGVSVEIIYSKESDYDSEKFEIMPDSYQELLKKHVGDVKNQENLLVYDSHFGSRYEDFFKLIPSNPIGRGYGKNWELPSILYDYAKIDFLNKEQSDQFRTNSNDINKKIERFSNLLKQKIDENKNPE